MEEILRILTYLVVGIILLIAFFIGGIIVESTKKWKVYSFIVFAYIIFFAMIALSEQKELEGFLRIIAKVLPYIALPCFVTAGSCIFYLVFRKKE